MPNVIKQLSIFVEDKTGELSDITSLLSENEINIYSINLAEASDFGILRVIVDDTQKAKEVLDGAGFSQRITDVFAVEIDDHVGSFNEVVSLLAQHDINLEYTYTVSNYDKGAFIFKVKHNTLAKTLALLEEAQINLLDRIK